MDPAGTGLRNPVGGLLAAGFVLSLSLTKLLILPGLGQKAQLPELFFLLLLFWTGLSLRRLPAADLYRRLPLDLPVFLLIVAYALPALLRPTTGALLEWCGRIYLAAIYVWVSRLAWKALDGEELFPIALRGLGLFTGLTVLLSAIWILFSPGSAPELSEPKYVPGLGYLHRIEAFTMGPNQLADILGLCLLVELSRRFEGVAGGKWSFRLLILLIIALLSTFSKSILLYLSGAGLLWSLYSPSSPLAPRRLALAFAGNLLVIGFLFFSHLLPVPASRLDSSRLRQQNYTTGRPVLTAGGITFIESTYIELKRQALRAGVVFFPLGAGGGGFQAFLANQQKAGRYPARLPLYDPHSSYFGALAEAGLLGLVATCWLFWAAIGQGIRVAERGGGAVGYLEKALLVYVIILAIQACCTDVMNFRHLWLALGLLGGMGLEKARYR